MPWDLFWTVIWQLVLASLILGFSFGFFIALVKTFGQLGDTPRIEKKDQEKVL